MALVKAVILGSIAALAIPWAIRGGTGEFTEWFHYGLVQLGSDNFHFAWSWPTFCAVTLFAWAMFAWADR